MKKLFLSVVVLVFGSLCYAGDLETTLLELFQKFEQGSFAKEISEIDSVKSHILCDYVVKNERQGCNYTVIDDLDKDGILDTAQVSVKVKEGKDRIGYSKFEKRKFLAKAFIDYDHDQVKEFFTYTHITCEPGPVSEKEKHIYSITDDFDSDGVMETAEFILTIKEGRKKIKIRIR